MSRFTVRLISERMIKANQWAYLKLKPGLILCPVLAFWPFWYVQSQTYISLFRLWRL